MKYKDFIDSVVIPAAHELAGKIISDARTLEGPVVWLTGNQYMPPARSFPEFEAVWQHELNGDGEATDVMWEEVKRLLEEAEVETFVPDWDNAIYAVDLKRWEHVDSDEDFDNVNDEWQRRQ